MEEEEYRHAPLATPSPSPAASGGGGQFEWQLYVGQQWVHIDNDVVIETHYCQPGAKGMTINTTSNGRVYIDFERVEHQSPGSGVRRVSRLPQGQAAEVGWYYRDDQLWTEYGSQGSSVTSKDVEQQFLRNPQGTFQFVVRGSAYSLALSAMKQTNQATGVQRAVRRRPKFSCLVPGNSSVSTSIATAAAAPPGGVLWEFMGEEGVWTEYQPHECSLDSAAIEGHYQQNQQGQLSFSVGRFNYTLDYTGMFQTNVAIGTRRAVRRTPGGQQSTRRSGPRWQFKDMDGTWTEYTTRGRRGRCSMSSQDIELQFQLNPQGCITFSTRRWKYELDFSAMTQRNLTTNTTRPVQRLDQ